MQRLYLKLGLPDISDGAAQAGRAGDDSPRRNPKARATLFNPSDVSELVLPA
jgi:hypothetical protein|tara:strand:- start:302 stop:457 length:156 start_codon:yes stop_codon:yes gene_type:complete